MNREDEMFLDVFNIQVMEMDVKSSNTEHLANDDQFDFDDENSNDSDSMILCFDDENSGEQFVFRQSTSTELNQSIGATSSIRLKSKFVDVSAMFSKPDLSRDMVILEIERLMEQQVDVLLDNSGSMSLSLKTMRTNRHQNAQHTRSTSKSQTYYFPGNSPSEAWRFTVAFRLLIMIHEALVTDVVLTKRDLYYRDPNLFRSQDTVDRYIDNIARTFEVPRSMLNITSAAKGLAAGNFVLEKLDGSKINGNEYNEGLLISSMASVDKVKLTLVKWILVVEKEATFRSLMESSFWMSARSSGILVTAKGYPDLLTREFLSLISNPSDKIHHHSCPVYGFFDFDPDGIGIFHTYKHGSINTAHEPGIKCTNMQWLGLMSKDLFFANKQSQNGLIQLSFRDRRRASQMLTWHAFHEHVPENVLRRELQVMLFLNKKAEIQLMESLPGGLSARLTNMITNVSID